MARVTSSISVRLFYLETLAVVLERIPSDDLAFVLFLLFFCAEGVLNKLINMEESIFIPVSRGEYAVLVSVFNVKNSFPTTFLFQFNLGEIPRRPLHLCLFPTETP